MLKSFQRNRGNAWVKMVMPDEKTILIRGEWHAHWVDAKLTYEMLCEQTWPMLLGSDVKVIRRVRASKELEEWIDWMMSQSPRTATL